MIIEVELEVEDTAIEHARVANWFVEEGEDVEAGEPLAEMVADDTMFEIKAPSDGTVVELRVEEDELVKVGDTVLLLEIEEEIDMGADDESRHTDDAGDEGEPGGA